VFVRFTEENVDVCAPKGRRVNRKKKKKKVRAFTEKVLKLLAKLQRRWRHQPGPP